MPLRARASSAALAAACALASATAFADDEGDLGMDLTGSLDETEASGEATSETPAEDERAAKDAEPAETGAAPVSPRDRSSSFGVGLDAYWDSGEQRIERINSGGGNLVEGRTDFSNEGFLIGSDLALVVWLMTGITDEIQIGGGVRLLGSYNYELDGGGTVKLGQTLELGPRAQYLLRITDTIGIPIGLEADLVLIFPGSDLSDRLDALEAQGFDTTGLPRLGYLFGPTVGVRYVGSEWIALRADLGWLWAKAFLLDATAESGGLQGEESWTVSWTRWRLHLGAELMF